MFYTKLLLHTYYEFKRFFNFLNIKMLHLAPGVNKPNKIHMVLCQLLETCRFLRSKSYINRYFKYLVLDFETKKKIVLFSNVFDLLLKRNFSRKFECHVQSIFGYSRTPAFLRVKVSHGKCVFTMI